MPQVLTATKTYLQHVAGILDIGNEDPNQLPPDLLRNIEIAAEHAQSELSCKCLVQGL